MLVLARKLDESIVIGPDITVTVLEIKGGVVRLGIAAPEDVPVNREEVSARPWRMCFAGREASRSPRSRRP